MIDWLKPYVDSETLSAIHKKHKLFKKYKKTGLETDKDHWSFSVRKLYVRKKKFHEKTEKNGHDSKKLWKLLSP